MIAMSQQVNLLVEDLLPRRMPLQFTDAAIACVVVALVLVGMTVRDVVALRGIGEREDTLTKQLAVLADANATMRGSVNAVEDPALAARVADLATQLASRTALEGALSRDATSLTAGFAGHFDTLAANALPRLWLTEIEIADGGHRVRLAGMTLDAVLVPKFLKGLGQGAAFSGRRFDAFELTADESGALRFTITGPAEEHTK